MKGLDAFKRLVRDYDYYDDGIDEERHEEDIEIIEKELKALEIIKNKEVDINNFLYFVNGLDDEDALGTYNGDVYRTDRQLTKQEYELLKEVLK